MADDTRGHPTRREVLRAAGAAAVGALLHETVAEAALPPEFADRIGEILRVRGPVIEARFDPEDLPKLLSTLAIRDGEREVTVAVAQRLRDGRVRCIAPGPLRGVRHGMKIAPAESANPLPIAGAALESAIANTPPPSSARSGLRSIQNTARLGGSCSRIEKSLNARSLPPGANQMNPFDDALITRVGPAGCG